MAILCIQARCWSWFFGPRPLCDCEFFLGKLPAQSWPPHGKEMAQKFESLAVPNLVCCNQDFRGGKVDPCSYLMLQPTLSATCPRLLPGYSRRRLLVGILSPSGNRWDGWRELSSSF